MNSYNVSLNRTDLDSNNNYDVNKLEDNLIKKIKMYFKKYNIKKNSHIFVVGLGNDNFTADSVGPKSLKNVKTTLISNDIKVSSLEPGVLGETGIKTFRIVESVTREIGPDIIILIDSFVSNNIDDLNKTIVINDIGLKRGSGIYELTSEFSYKTLGVPTIVIGVVTAVEMTFLDLKKNYILSTKNIDTYIDSISKTIGNSINKTIDDLL